MPKGCSDGSGGRANHNGRSIDGAYPARCGESFGCKGPVALLQALDLFESLDERPELGVVSEQLCDGFGSHGQWGEDRLNIILVSDSLAKSRSLALSQSQVLLIAFGILMAGFLLATATYVVTMKFAVDLRNP